MNKLPSYLRRGPALHQTVQGQPEDFREARRHEQFPLLFWEGARTAWGGRQ
jgi:hypothetical protein